MAWYWWIVLILVAFFVLAYFQNKMRRARLMEKYGDAELVNQLMKRMFWQGQSEEQLLDSLGKPLDIDQKVLKTKTKEVWKYNETGKGRYALRITLENGEVVGWDKKQFSKYLSQPRFQVAIRVEVRKGYIACLASKHSDVYCIIVAYH